MILDTKQEKLEYMRKNLFLVMNEVVAKLNDTTPKTWETPVLPIQEIYNEKWTMSRQAP